MFESEPVNLKPAIPTNDFTGTAWLFARRPKDIVDDYRAEQITSAPVERKRAIELKKYHVDKNGGSGRRKRAR